MIDPVLDTVARSGARHGSPRIDPVLDTIAPVLDPGRDLTAPVLDTVAPGLAPVVAPTAPVLDTVAPQVAAPTFGAPQAATPVAGDAPSPLADAPAAPHGAPALAGGGLEIPGSGSWIPSLAQGQPLSPTFTAPPAADPSPQNQLPGSPSGSSSTAPAGGAFSAALYALLIALGVLALCQYGRLHLAPARWRCATFVALLERPG